MGVKTSAEQLLIQLLCPAAAPADAEPALTASTINEQTVETDTRSAEEMASVSIPCPCRRAALPYLLLHICSVHIYPTH